MFYNSIPVVMYHHIMPKTKDLSVTPEIFEEHLLALKSKGWKTLNSEEFLNLMMNPNYSRKKCIVLTFDDGFVDNYIFAYPILKRYKMKAILFIATDFISEVEIKRESFRILSHKEMWEIAHTERKYEVMCTWSELREMESEGVFDIQSHGHSHRVPDFIRTKNYEKVKRDLEESKSLIKKQLNKIPLHLAWPKGMHDEKSIEIANLIGFRALYTTERGSNTNDLKKIGRLPVKNKGANWLISRISIYNASFFSKIYSKIRYK